MNHLNCYLAQSVFNKGIWVGNIFGCTLHNPMASPVCIHCFVRKLWMNLLTVNLQHSPTSNWDKKNSSLWFSSLAVFAQYLQYPQYLQFLRYLGWKPQSSQILGTVGASEVAAGYQTGWSQFGPMAEIGRWTGLQCSTMSFTTAVWPGQWNPGCVLGGVGGWLGC